MLTYIEEYNEHNVMFDEFESVTNQVIHNFTQGWVTS